MSWAALVAGSDADDADASEAETLEQPGQGLKWWDTVKQAAAPQRGLRGNQLRDLKVISLCSGLGTETYCLSKLGVGVSLEASCDPKPASIDIHKTGTLGHKSKHHFDDVCKVVDKGARCPCLFHPNQECDLNEVGPDMLVSGFPCQPYTTQSTQRFKHNGVTTHHLYPLTNYSVQAVSILHPKVFIFENVIGFAKRVPGKSMTPCEATLKAVEETGKYYTVCFTLDLAHWVEADRSSQSFSNKCIVHTALRELEARAYPHSNSTGNIG